MVAAGFFYGSTGSGEVGELIWRRGSGSSTGAGCLGGFIGPTGTLTVLVWRHGSLRKFVGRGARGSWLLGNQRWSTDEGVSWGCLEILEGVEGSSFCCLVEDWFSVDIVFRYGWKVLSAVL